VSDKIQIVLCTVNRYKQILNSFHDLGLRGSGWGVGVGGRGRGRKLPILTTSRSRIILSSMRIA
jgi:hypothetical protein